jgi:hypothetical protein
VDKYLAFTNVDGDNAEIYDAMRSAGYMNLGQQGQVNDITPRFPPETLPYIKMLMDSFNIIGGFPDIMQGQGSSGVRAGVHADTLLKTGSPRLRDMSLAIERCCAKAAEITLALKEAKDGSNYWTEAKNIADIERTSFLLTDLPRDRRVSVDAHSTSPIFADDHQQLVAFASKQGWIDAEEAFKMLPFPNPDFLIAKYKENAEARSKARDEMMSKLTPEMTEKVVLKEITGGKS